MRGSFINVESEIYCNQFFFLPWLTQQVESKKINRITNMARLVVNLQKWGLPAVTRIIEQKKKLCDVNKEHSIVKVSWPARCVIITAGDRSDSPAAALMIPGKIPRVCCIAQFASYVHHARSCTVALSRQSSAHSESCSNGRHPPVNYSVSGIRSMSRVETTKERLWLVRRYYA